MPRATVLCLLALLAVAVAAGCGPRVPMTAWSPMAGPQVSVPLGAGTAVVEVRSERDGWTETLSSEGVGEQTIETRVDAAPVPNALERALGPCAEVGGQLDDGERFNCQALANQLRERLRAEGIPVRRVDLAVRLGSPYEGHSVVEVWSAETGSWVLLDAFFGSYYTIGGRPASALDLHRAVLGGRASEISIVQLGGAEGVGADPWTSRISPLAFFRTVLLELPDGAWLVYAEPGRTPDVVSRPGLVTTSSTAPFLAPPGETTRVAVSREVRARHGVVAEALDGRLYVAVPVDGFEQAAYSVRVSEGRAVETTPALAVYDLDDAFLCRPGELLDRPPSSWPVGGTPAAVERDGDALVLETGDAPCRVEAEVATVPGLPLVSTARVRVERGSAEVASIGRRRQFVLAATAGPETQLSPVIVKSRERDGVAVTVAPHSRCRIAAIHMRYGRPLSDFVTRAARKEERATDEHR